jgi:hypothetical protein
MHTMLRRWAVVASILLTFGGLGSAAGALSLADAVAGATLESGGLVFSDFQVALTGDLSSDLDDYAILGVGSGITLTGDITQVFGEGGTLTLGYQVSVLDASQAITGALLSFDGQVLGPGAYAFVTEGISDAGYAGLGSLFVYDFGAGGSQGSDSLEFSDQATLNVTKTIQLDATGFGALLATAGSIQQHFTVVPEPQTLATVGLGLLGLGVAGRKRR